MPMANVLSVREFDTITCNEDYKDSQYYKYLDKKYFGELKTFIEAYSSENDGADILEFMKLGFKRGIGSIRRRGCGWCRSGSGCRER